MKHYAKPFSFNLAAVHGVAPAPFALGVLAGKAAATAVAVGIPALVAGGAAAAVSSMKKGDNIMDMRKVASLVPVRC